MTSFSYKPEFVNIGQARLSYHNIGMQIKTIVDNLNEPALPGINGICSQGSQDTPSTVWGNNASQYNTQRQDSVCSSVLDTSQHTTQLKKMFKDADCHMTQMPQQDFESSLAEFQETQPIRINTGVAGTNMDIVRECDSRLTVECPCGIKASERDMLCCDLCRNWGHLYCYGYLSRTDARLPKRHICYTCTVNHLNAQGKLLTIKKQNMRHIALNRRALGIIWNEGWPNTAAMFTRRAGVS
ncbi:hypothetical protein BDF19DRAFT_411840 [Syncephalis fuscata]|nr:hypothetical protein BDF19DRAFT_411840 [Syncephalis fuscata]